jgi:hypothetical protein
MMNVLRSTRERGLVRAHTRHVSACPQNGRRCRRSARYPRKADPAYLSGRTEADIRWDVKVWGARIDRVIKKAGVGWVELPTRDKQGRFERKAAKREDVPSHVRSPAAKGGAAA